MLEIVQPVQKRGKLRLRDLAPLVHGVRRGIPIGQDEAAAFVDPAPVLLVRGVTVHRVERGGGAGVHVRGLVPESAAEIQADEGGGFLLIAGKDRAVIGDPLPVKALPEHAVLRGFSAAVDALENDQFSFAHSYFLLTTAHT